MCLRKWSWRRAGLGFPHIGRSSSRERDRSRAMAKVSLNFYLIWDGACLLLIRTFLQKYMAKQLLSDGVRFLGAKNSGWNSDYNTKIIYMTLLHMVPKCLLLELPICTTNNVVPFRDKLASKEAFTCFVNRSALHIKLPASTDGSCDFIAQPGIKRQSHRTCWLNGGHMHMAYLNSLLMLWKCSSMAQPGFKRNWRGTWFQIFSDNLQFKDSSLIMSK